MSDEIIITDSHAQWLIQLAMGNKSAAKDHLWGWFCGEMAKRYETQSPTAPPPPNDVKEG